MTLDESSELGSRRHDDIGGGINMWEEPDFQVIETGAEASAYAYRK